MKTLTMAIVGLGVIWGSTAWADDDKSNDKGCKKDKCEMIEISAPILPQVLMLYEHEGEAFPATLDEEKDLVAQASLLFDELLVDCKNNADFGGAYDGITLWKEGDKPLKDEQLSANYRLVAKCSYEHFTAKPYWLPKLVDDVDICGMELGEGWRLPTATDVASLNIDDLDFIQMALAGVSAEADFWESFYFLSMEIYARADDGSLAQASFDPAHSGDRVFPGEWVDPLRHFEGGIALRCLRVTSML